DAGGAESPTAAGNRGTSAAAAGGRRLVAAGRDRDGADRPLPDGPHPPSAGAAAAGPGRRQGRRFRGGLRAAPDARRGARDRQLRPDDGPCGGGERDAGDGAPVAPAGAGRQGGDRRRRCRQVNRRPVDQAPRLLFLVPGRRRCQLRQRAARRAGGAGGAAGDAVV
ncbi:MAG: hypothetical protein AVDCRST_MAG19-1891, partial [uncultured Thermomicrobiales bacterium]